MRKWMRKGTLWNFAGLPRSPCGPSCRGPYSIRTGLKPLRFRAGRGRHRAEPAYPLSIIILSIIFLPTMVDGPRADPGQETHLLMPPEVLGLVGAGGIDPAD